MPVNISVRAHYDVRKTGKPEPMKVDSFQYTAATPAEEARFTALRAKLKGLIEAEQGTAGEGLASALANVGSITISFEDVP